MNEIESDDALRALLSQPVGELEDALAAAELSPASLARMRELEQADGSPRKGALKAIDRAAADNSHNDNAGGSAGDAPPAAPAEPPEWQAPDYAGPLDAAQANWRVANIKPVRGTVTK